MLAAVLDRLDPQMNGMRRDWSGIFAESERVLYEVCVQRFGVVWTEQYH